MVMMMLERERAATSLRFLHESIRLQTNHCLEFIDITEPVREIVTRAEIVAGIVNIQTRHTTTAVIINEHEPLLLDDLRDALERLAPQTVAYRHNDFTIRTVNLTPDEHENGHSHCKSLFLRTSETINLVGGELQLGRWQRIFFLELDCARAREISIVVMGQAIELESLK